MKKVVNYKVQKEEWEAAKNEAFKKIGAKLKVDGFRPGKAPRHLVEKKKDDCCPGTKPVNEAEAIDAVLHDIDQQILNEAKEVNRKKEQKLNIKVLNAINERSAIYTNILDNDDKIVNYAIKNIIGEEND